jgi:hypothetical protein
MLISVLDSYGVEVLLRIYQSHLDAPGADAPVGPVPSAVVGQSNGEAISSVKSGRGGARSVGARACKPTTSPLTTDPTPQAHNGTRRRIAVGPWPLCLCSDPSRALRWRQQPRRRWAAAAHGRARRGPEPLLQCGASPPSVRSVGAPKTAPPHATCPRPQPPPPIPRRFGGLDLEEALPFERSAGRCDVKLARRPASHHPAARARSRRQPGCRGHAGDGGRAVPFVLVRTVRFEPRCWCAAPSCRGSSDRTRLAYVCYGPVCRRFHRR